MILVELAIWLFLEFSDEIESERQVEIHRIMNVWLKYTRGNIKVRF